MHICQDYSAIQHKADSILLKIRSFKIIISSGPDGTVAINHYSTVMQDLLVTTYTSIVSWKLTPFNVYINQKSTSHGILVALVSSNKPKRLTFSKHNSQFVT